jgi:hypothetical protein
LYCEEMAVRGALEAAVRASHLLHSRQDMELDRELAAQQE